MVEAFRMGLFDDGAPKEALMSDTPMCDACGEQILSTRPDTWLGRDCQTPHCPGTYRTEEEAVREMEQRVHAREEAI